MLYILAYFGGWLPVADDGVSAILRGLALTGIVSATLSLVFAISRAIWGRLTSRADALKHAVRNVREQRRDREIARQRGIEASRREQELREKHDREQQIEIPIARESQRRREDARLRCEQFYVLHPELKASYPREQFDDFLARHLGDERSPERVEQQAERLIEMFRAMVAPADNKSLAETVTALASQFQQQKDEIEALQIDGELKETLLFQLRTTFLGKLQNRLEQS